MEIKEYLILCNEISLRLFMHNEAKKAGKPIRAAYHWHMANNTRMYLVKHLTNDKAFMAKAMTYDRMEKVSILTHLASYYRGGNAYIGADGMYQKMHENALLNLGAVVLLKRCASHMVTAMEVSKQLLSDGTIFKKSGTGAELRYVVTCLEKDLMDIVEVESQLGGI